MFQSCMGSFIKSGRGMNMATSSILENIRVNNPKAVEEFVLAMEVLHQAKLVPYLKEHNWTEFAKRYNGPNYSKNSYNRKLKSAFLAFLSQK